MLRRSIFLLGAKVRFVALADVSSASSSFSTSPNQKKSFKHKPLSPKPKIPTPEEIFEEQNKWNIPPGGYFLLIIPVTTLVLGIWQVYRWRWKLELVDNMESKVHALPMHFPVGNLESLPDLEYRKVMLRGKFDYSKQILMGPRSLINYAEHIPTGGRVFSQGTAASGYHIVTPFQIEGQTTSILVNRGWIPDRNTHKYNCTDETVEILGVVRNTEQRQPFMPKNTGNKQGFLMFRDVPAMAEMLKTDEAFLDLVSINGVDLSSARLHNLPVPGQTRVTLRNEHVSYFCTWFSLSGITAFMWFRRFIMRQPLI